MKHHLLISILFGVVLFATINASAVTTIGGINFEDNAFADTLIQSVGAFDITGGTLADVLTDIDEGTFAFSFTPGAFVELGFTDNVLVNGGGDDLALFELGVPDSFDLSLTLGGVTNNYLSVDTGFDAAGFNLNVATINLDDFGVASGASVSSLVVGLDTLGSGGTVPSLALVGAINSIPVDGSGGAAVPEPSTYALFIIGLVGLGYCKRGKNNPSCYAVN